ncbi:MAG TPA: hypothetical protein VFN48_05415 [Solirubrobacteraceae bacterium]|nr:hypothetical protein [Solirubrobacteraceae bacterium]
MRRPGTSHLTRTLLVLILLAGTGLAGCGTTLLHTRSTRSQPPSFVGPAAQSQVNVIRSWARALRRGDINAAADLFALPSLFANGPGGPGPLGGQVIRSHQNAVAANESLTCGAEVVSTIRHGRYVIATFKLVNRVGPGAGCGGGVGQQAATAFLIRHGRIIDWIRAPLLNQVSPHGGAPAPTSSGPGTFI